MGNKVARPMACYGFGTGQCENTDKTQGTWMDDAYQNFSVSHVDVCTR